jgi:hypothetical protein
MSKLRQRVIVSLGGMLTLGILVLVYWLLASTPAAIARTKVQLVLYQTATTNFFGRVGRWPISPTELISNSMGQVFIYPPAPGQDGWGRQIVYEPFTTNAGYGRVISYGRDGKLGGTGADADIELRFP